MLHALCVCACTHVYQGLTEIASGSIDTTKARYIALRGLGNQMRWREREGGEKEKKSKKGPRLVDASDQLKEDTGRRGTGRGPLPPCVVPNFMGSVAVGWSCIVRSFLWRLVLLAWLISNTDASAPSPAHRTTKPHSFRYV